MMLSWNILISLSDISYEFIDKPNLDIYASDVNLQLEFEKRKDVATEKAMYEAEVALHLAR